MKFSTDNLHVSLRAYRWIGVLGLLAGGLQGCGGTSSSADNASLTPSAEAFTKDWVHEGEDKLLILGNSSVP